MSVFLSVCLSVCLFVFFISFSLPLSCCSAQAHEASSLFAGPFAFSLHSDPACNFDMNVWKVNSILAATSGSPCLCLAGEQTCSRISSCLVIYLIAMASSLIVMASNLISIFLCQDGFALAPYWEPSAVEGFGMHLEDEQSSECNIAAYQG